MAQDPIRQQRAAARRNQILDGAARVFAEKGFHRASTREIARAAGVSEGTIYNYFDSKAGLVVGLMTRLAEVESLGDELSDTMPGDIREFFVATFRRRFARLASQEKLFRAVLPEVLVDPELRETFHQQYVLRIAGLLEQYLQAQVAAGRMRPVDVPLAVRSLQGMFVGLLVLRIFGDETTRQGWDDLPEVLATLILDGLRLPRADEEVAQ